MMFSEPTVLTGQEIIEAASAYPPMIMTMCYDSAEILVGVYQELRIAEGTRSSVPLGVTEPRTIAHGWCVKPDGTIIDPVFSQEIASDPDLDPNTVRVTYSEHVTHDAQHCRPAGQLRDQVRHRANRARPPLRRPSQRWKFAEEQRDAWVAAANQAAGRRWGIVRRCCTARTIPARAGQLIPASTDRREQVLGLLGDSRDRVQAGFFPWSQDYPVPSDFVGPLLGCGSFLTASPANLNTAEFYDPRIDAQARHARTLQLRAPAAAVGRWTVIDRELADEAPWVPLYNPRDLTVLSARVGNYQFHPHWDLLIDQLWVR
jgi:hypothetical protein